MATSSTIIGYAENWLGFNRSDIGIPGLEEAQLLEVCNQAVIEYYEAHRQGGGEPPTMFQRETGAELTADTTTTEAVTSATTDFDVTSSTNLPASGVVALWDDDQADYAAFTGNAANNLTGVSGLGYNHASGVIVSRLYPLPSNFSDFRSEQESPDGTTVDGSPMVHSAASPIGNTFFLYDNGTTKYMHFPRGLTGGWSTRYNAKPTTIDDTADSVDIPEKDLWFAVWRIAQYAAPILGKFDQFKIAQGQADSILSRALINRNIGKRPKLRPMGMSYREPSNPDYR